MGFFKDFFKDISDSDPINNPSPFEQIDDEIEAIPTYTPLLTETNPTMDSPNAPVDKVISVLS